MPGIQVTLEQFNSLELSDLEELYESVTEFDDTPVDISTFLDGSKYLGSYFEGSLFPYWKEVLKEIYPSVHYSPYWLCCIKGSIGCFTGDTKISLLDGTEISFKELVDKDVKEVDLYSWDNSRKQVVPGKGYYPRITGYVNELMEITLDNGFTEKCTLNHPWLLRNGTYKRADELLPGDSLMPLYRRINLSGYEEILYDQENWYQTHWVVAWSKYGKENCYKRIDPKCGNVIHHSSFNKRNNNPSELELMSWFSHGNFHVNNYNFRDVWVDPIKGELLRKTNSEMTSYLNTLPNIIKKQQKTKRENGTYLKYAVRLIEFNKNHPSKRDDITIEKIIDISSNIKTLSEISWGLKCSRQRIYSVFKENGYDWNSFATKYAPNAVLDKTFFARQKVKENRLIKNTNHKVVLVNKIVFADKVPVYDVTVDQHHNFALSSGVFVHNTGKTTVAAAGMLYDLYRLLCHKNPQKVLGGIPSDKIDFAIFNVTLSLAADVVWDKISQMFSKSEYFTKQMEISKKKRKEETLFPKRIDFFSGSRVGHSLGRSIFSVILDEANFEIVTGQIRKTFYSLLRRMSSRFMEIGGGFPGKIWVVSSETDKSSVLNNLIEEYRNSSGVYICQPALWNVRTEKYLGKRFKVYKGSDLKPPTIIDKTNEKQYEDEEENIIQVPEEHRGDFESSINDALRDLAGVSTGSRYKLFKLKEKMTQALCVNLLFPETVDLEFYDETDQIYNKVLIPSYFNGIAYSNYPRYLHIDIGLSGDRLGLACSYVSQYKEIQRRDITTFNMMVEAVPELVVEFAFGIQAKVGQQIPLFKVRSFILWLASKGYVFGMISSDLGSAMAADMLQLLRRLGFSTQDLSVDKTSLPYLKLRSMVYEDLIFMPMNKILRTELEDLEVSPDGAKIDHPLKGSKDIADAVAGSVISVIRNSDKYKMIYVTSPRPHSVNTEVKQLFWPSMVEDDI